MRQSVLAALIAQLCLIAPAALAQAPIQAPGFTDRGIGANVAENGGAVITRDAAGHNLVIANSMDISPRGWILLTDIDSEETQQIYFPEGVGNGDPYASLMHSNGKFYTANGRTFLVFDPNSREFIFHGEPAPDQGVYMAMIEAPDGTIWTGGTPKTVLWSFDPKTNKFTDHGSMDPAEKYLSCIAVDDAGWVYGGIGTAKCNIVAYNPTTHEKLQLIPQDQRTTGTAQVYRGEDGAVYARAKLKDGTRCYRIHAGQAETIERADMARQQPDMAIFGAKRRYFKFPDGRCFSYYNMIRKWMDINDAQGDGVKRIHFDYEAGGLQITSFALGPDDTAYASTCHPMHLLSFDANAKKLTDFGPITKVGGGNFCSIATQGGKVFGVAYDDGTLYEYDPTMPWTWTHDRSGMEFCDTPTEKLVRSARMQKQDGHVWFQGPQNVALIEARKSGVVADFPLEAPDDDDYYLHVFPYLCTYYGTGHFLFDGKAIGEPYDAKARDKVSTTGPGPMRVYGPLKLKAGLHTFSVRTEFDQFADRFFGLTGLVLSKDKHDASYFVNLRNPRSVAQWRGDISRPRAALAHPDGKHVLMGGHAGYGLNGGGLGIYNTETGESILLKDDDHMPSHATIALAALPNGDVVGGTSADARGGGHSAAVEAEVYIMDWKTKEVVFHKAPAPGDRNIMSVKVAPDGLIYGLSKGSVFFVVDPQKQEIVHTENLADYGSAMRHALQLGPDGNLYAIFTDAMVKITPGSFAHEKLADNPVRATAAGALVNGMLVFAHYTHVWTYDIPDL